MSLPDIADRLCAVAENYVQGLQRVTWTLEPKGPGGRHMSFIGTTKSSPAGVPVVRQGDKHVVELEFVYQQPVSLVYGLMHYQRILPTLPHKNNMDYQKEIILAAVSFA